MNFILRKESAMMTTTEPLLLRSEVKKEESDLHHHHHHHHMCGMEDCSPADSSLYSPTTTGLQLEVIYIHCVPCPIRLFTFSTPESIVG
ncbi:hypothetical protein DAPPUDRAFT_314319 [Daphnia pulex]|uniref:Uncharacterized protein n=1 Tax=Daphnia pulex TaxID=6669 RepID=E9G6R9_DAPPU|nr:hypothetical protein DAPPUDRAFT_314319 [Daphnia pulex]|eukprot:EFX85142.1 hypothetical protein DAPPUDRAFT_314319 [Daphnia pulex]